MKGVPATVATLKRPIGMGSGGALQATGVIALAVAMPIAHGGGSPGARACMVAGSAFLMASEWVPRTLSGKRLELRDRAWLGVWIVLSGLVALQLAPLPASTLSLVGAYPTEFLAAADVPVLRISPTPMATAAYWATFTAYWSVAWMTAHLRRVQVFRLGAALSLLAVFESFYGVYALAHGSESVLGIWPKEHYLSDATGTFVNRNHFAGLLALCWPVALAWMLGSGRADRQVPLSLRQALALGASLLIGTALVASHSRLGLLAAGVGLTVYFTLSARSSSPSRPVYRWFSWAVLAAVFIAAVWSGPGRLVERFLELTQGQERFAVWSAMFDLPSRTWLLGAGAGSFADVFKTVQPAVLRNSYAYAHNDALEFLFDFGVVGALLIGFVAWRWWRRTKPREFAGLQVGALSGIAAMAVHSVGDFNLQIPGVAFVFWTCVGFALNRNVANGPRGGQIPREPGSDR